MNKGKYNHAFCSLINRDGSNCINKLTKLKPRDIWIWKFNNEKERRNFLNYCQTKIAKFSQAIYKFDGNVNMNDVPWFDFSTELNDKILVNILKLSIEEWEFIDSFIEK